VRPPLAEFPPHSAPVGMTFYTGKAYPPEYFDNAFISLWSRGELLRIELAQDGRGNYGSKPSVFGDGFLYPIDVITGPDGNLYLADFGTSVVYRITYDGAK
jgi:glucose/arabinose dehydrogenase